MLQERQNGIRVSGAHKESQIDRKFWHVSAYLVSLSGADGLFGLAFEIGREEYANVMNRDGVLRSLSPSDKRFTSNGHEARHFSDINKLMEKTRRSQEKKSERRRKARQQIRRAHTAPL